MAKRHNYKTLASQALALIEQGSSANAASETVAEQVDPVNADSVARSIRRHLRKAPPSPGIPQARIGLGVIYHLVRDRMKLIREECLGISQTSRQFDIAARKAERIRALLEARLKEVKALSPEKAILEVRALLHGLDEADPELMDPAAILAREIEDLETMIETARSLQGAIDAWRPDPSYRDF